MKWATHCVNCLASCTYRSFALDGDLSFQEQAGVYPVTQEGVPDRNPMGCQKGAAWVKQLVSGDRILYPMQRKGERGSGSWEQISWDDALAKISEVVVKTIIESGPEAILIDESAEGGILAIAAHLGFAQALGAVSLDGIATVNDFPAGHYITFGNIAGGATADDTFHAELVLICHANPAYSRIAYFHYLTEARYKGAEIALIAPDFSPSATHCDYFIPVKLGSDAALALSMCKVIIDENLFDETFIATQTDLALLVRTDNRLLLRDSDLQSGGSNFGFYLWNSDSGLTRAPEDSLNLDFKPSLRGQFSVELVDGSIIKVTTVFNLLLERLKEYAPEDAGRKCDVHPNTIRELARKVARSKTKILEGFDTPKHYHGDLMERSMDLLLALSGNWGAQGRGLDTYCVFPFDGSYIQGLKQSSGLEGADAVIDMARQIFGELPSGAETPPAMSRESFWELMSMAALTASTTPPFFFWLDHCGFGENWEKPEWGSSPSSLDTYVKKSRPDWERYIRPGPKVNPRVLFEPGTNALRRTRGGGRGILANLWPKLDLIVSIDQRINGAGMYADILLPAAHDTERVNLQYPITHSLELAFSDKVSDPRGQARSDWQIFCDIADAIATYANEHSFGETLVGRFRPHRLGDTGVIMHKDGSLRSDEALLDELVRDSALSGVFDKDTSLTSLRDSGYAQVTGNGSLPSGRMLGSRIRADETFSAQRWSVEGGMPYATTTGRATFYVDHPWFLEAGEELPTHKDPPRVGGDRRFALTGGHPRWSIHACNSTNPVILETTRGHPTLVINPRDAQELQICDDDLVQVENDLGTFVVHARVGFGSRPGQVVLYSAWESYGFSNWQDGTMIEAGMVKWLHLATDWGHLRFMPEQWQPSPSDRATRVDLKKVRGPIRP